MIRPEASQATASSMTAAAPKRTSLLFDSFDASENAAQAHGRGFDVGKPDSGWLAALYVHDSALPLAPNPASAHRVRILFAAALVGVTLLTYANAFNATYQFDDFAAILANPATQGIAGWWHALPGIRPLLKLSFALTAEFDGDAIAVHAANIAIHALNACLLWMLWRLWLPRLAPSLEHADLVALFAALLFAVHPAATEAVTYASGRSMSLSATFVLAALIADEASRTQPSRRWLAWRGPALFSLALAVRETAIVTPAIPLLLAWVTGQSLRAEAWRLRRYAIVAGVVAFAMAATPGYHTFFGVSLDTRSFAAQLMGQLLAHGYLLAHALTGLCNIDPDLRVPDAWSPMLAGCALLLAVLFTAMLAARRRVPWLAFAIGWYFLLLAPANSLLPRLDLANDRHLYLPIAGLALAATCTLARIASRHALRAAACTLALALVAGSMIATRQRNGDYRSEISLWQATVRDSPRKARAWLNLGYAYRLSGDAERAAHAYGCALALDPGNAQAAINLDLVASGGLAPLRCPEMATSQTR